MNDFALVVGCTIHAKYKSFTIKMCMPSNKKTREIDGIQMEGEIWTFFHLKTPHRLTYGKNSLVRFSGCSLSLSFHSCSLCPYFLFLATKYVLEKCDKRKKKKWREIGKSYIIQMKIALSSRGFYNIYSCSVLLFHRLFSKFTQHDITISISLMYDAFK